MNIIDRFLGWILILIMIGVFILLAVLIPEILKVNLNHSEPILEETVIFPNGWYPVTHIEGYRLMCVDHYSHYKRCIAVIKYGDDK